MSAFQKLFIASAIIGAGFGVAHLLGEPVSIKQALVGGEYSAPAFRNESSDSSTSAPFAANTVQLVPESSTRDTASVATANQSSPSLLERPPILSLPAAASARAPNAGLQFGSMRAAPSPLEVNGTSPARARLRSEAPRPFGNEPRSPATIRRAPPEEPEVSTAPNANRADQLSSAWSAPTVQAAQRVGFVTSEPTSVAATAIYDATSASINRTPVAPPPWPASIDGVGPRLHVVIDGDSLERLANRYLDDPRRSREIYDLNRELLTSPDLLPIGVELKIPDRSARGSWDRAND